MEIRNVVSISNMEHKSEVDLCVHCQSQEFIAELQGSLGHAGRDSAAFTWRIILCWSFHFDGNNKIQVLFSNSAFTAGFGI